jgi:acyl CoA:acetate/3-ketoacid CoA transferase beta subunit
VKASQEQGDLSNRKIGWNIAVVFKMGGIPYILQYSSIVFVASEIPRKKSSKATAEIKESKRLLYKAAAVASYYPFLALIAFTLTGYNV